MGTLNLKHDLEKELSERIPIREGDRKLRVSKQRALLKAILAKALKGDTRAAGILLQLMAKMSVIDEPCRENEDTISDDELTIVEQFLLRRSREKAKPIDGGFDEPQS